ncbi:hypothetical protein [Sinorhizobium meliloti]|uniref:hypothetical protein n=1 Tax=Rhizobium meliloti TaxID=382 RepID=UPI0013E31495|nr:hypothetical protein [Sinorhizobium meliloti]
MQPTRKEIALNRAFEEGQEAYRRGGSNRYVPGTPYHDHFEQGREKERETVEE